MFVGQVDTEDEPYEMIQDFETLEQYPTLDDFPRPSEREPLEKKSLVSSPNFNQLNKSGSTGSMFKFNDKEKENQSNMGGQEFTKKLMDKVKKQAETILQLENYKLMTEKKMNDWNHMNSVPDSSTQQATGCKLDVEEWGYFDQMYSDINNQWGDERETERD